MAISDTDAIKEKIRKLMAVANDDGAMGNEITNALTFARMLMQRHNFTEADLANPKDAHERAANVEYGQAASPGLGRKLTAWEGTLALAVCDLIGTIKRYQNILQEPKKNGLGTVKFDSNGNAEYGQHIMFYGPIEDCRDAVDLYTEWSTLISAMARMKYGTVLRGPGRSYSEGFANTLYWKMQDIKKDEKKLIEANCTTTALVTLNANHVMEGKRKAAEEWLGKKMGIKLRKTQGSKNLNDADAYHAGMADGSKANFTRQIKQKITGA